MINATYLLKNGRKSEIWSKYCGFLELSLNEYMQIQDRLLMEQISLLSQCPLGERFFGSEAPRSVEEFRQSVPITSYEDYETDFEEQREDALPAETYLWAHTSGRSGRLKWIPYTKAAYRRLGERVFAGVILATARDRGDIRLELNDTLVYNTPPRPFVSGVSLRALAEEFNFQFIPGLDVTEKMTFQERIEKGFETGLITGIDVLGSISVILVKMGERFAEGANTTKFSTRLLHPSALFRLGRGLMRSKLEGRKMLPKDIWHIKGLPCGGMDTEIYRDKIMYYWGVTPYEQYGSTEEGAIAAQAWNKKGMTFFPDAAFLEFIPEEEWARGRKDPTYQPQTVLMNEVEPGKRYEVVISNFYGKPLVRYRLHDLIQFTSLEDPETGVKLPQMRFIGRCADFIDLAGFTGLIDEKMVWQAIVNSGIRYEEWTMRKEQAHGQPFLHLYIELVDLAAQEAVRARVHQELKTLNPFYADYEAMIGINPLKVTLLCRGTYQAYMREMQAAGADLAHLKPTHMNASDEVIEILLRLSHKDQ